VRLIIILPIINYLATPQSSAILSLSEEQIEMLLMSKVDIASGNLISEEELDQLDANGCILKIEMDIDCQKNKRQCFRILE
jgi:hypothetical protein